MTQSRAETRRVSRLVSLSSSARCSRRPNIGQPGVSLLVRSLHTATQNPPLQTYWLSRSWILSFNTLRRKGFCRTAFCGPLLVEGPAESCPHHPTCTGREARGISREAGSRPPARSFLWAPHDVSDQQVERRAVPFNDLNGFWPGLCLHSSLGILPSSEIPPPARVRRRRPRPQEWSSPIAHPWGMQPRLVFWRPLVPENKS